MCGTVPPAVEKTNDRRQQMKRTKDRQDYKDRCKPNLVDNPELLMPMWYWVASAIITAVILWGIA
jgi:hypothetical protein